MKRARKPLLIVTGKWLRIMVCAQQLVGSEELDIASKCG